MRCPFCGYIEDKVVDSRAGKVADTIRRRRECMKCGRRFTTYERIDEIPYMVVKKDGSREKLDRQKILGGPLKVHIIARPGRTAAGLPLGGCRYRRAPPAAPASGTSPF